MDIALIVPQHGVVVGEGPEVEAGTARRKQPQGTCPFGWALDMTWMSLAVASLVNYQDVCVSRTQPN